MHITYSDPPLFSLWIHEFPSSPPILCHLCVTHCVEGFFTRARATYQRLHQRRRISLAQQPLAMNIIKEGQVFLKPFPSTMERQAHGIDLEQVAMEAAAHECSDHGHVQKKACHNTPPHSGPNMFFSCSVYYLILCTRLCKGIWLHRYCWFRNFELMALDTILYTWESLFKHGCSFCARHSTVLYEQHLTSVLRAHVRLQPEEMRRCKIVGTR